MGFIEQRAAKAVPFWLSPDLALLRSKGGGGTLRQKSFTGPFAARRRDEEPGRFEMQTLSVEDMDRDFAAWRDLAARALEPNAFFEPGFALSLSRHSPRKARPRFVAIWRVDGEAPRRLVGLFPMASARPWLGRRLAALWLDRQAALAAPLVDCSCAEEVLTRYFEWLGSAARVEGVLFPRIVAGGALHQAIAEASRNFGSAPVVIEKFERAALFKGSDRDDLCVRGGSKKALKDLRRRQRRLQEEGALAFTISATAQETRVAAERFLALEAAGWKRASAFLSQPMLTAFFRSATRLMARDGKCRVATLSLDDRPLAMGIVLESQDRAFFWKIAFDEAHRAAAPGIHLVYELTQALAARESVAITDSAPSPIIR